MPRTEEANQRIREEQRAKILEAAWKVFARKGMAATMAEVATAADVSYGLAYRYFASKEALFRALVEQIMQDGPARLQRFLEMPGTPGERLTRLISGLVERRSEHPELFQLLNQVLNDETTPDDLGGLIRRQIQTFLDVLKQLIVEGQATGEIANDDPDQLVTAIIACLGFSRGAARFNKHFPNSGIILRMLKPSTDQP
ncbi:MAG: TetR/AcrR family transcriptional regulator [Ktedonobacteraceae bacterium]|nr:TetR/AcrR family transcriptional regulator [Ktedonobacteraceae bacterium]